MQSEFGMGRIHGRVTLARSAIGARMEEIRDVDVAGRGSQSGHRRLSAIGRWGAAVI